MKPGPKQRYDVWISLKLTREQRASLNAFAALWHMTRSEAVRWLIDYVPTLIGTPEEAQHERV